MEHWHKRYVGFGIDRDGSIITISDIDICVGISALAAICYSTKIGSAARAIHHVPKKTN